mmetsp:Transcript_98282/g.174177  ORF Transcript_98282/g.174177 Transcript_98282/m.174177 type:complete len:312 (-) Transcript_98282:326-1261(-)
MLDHNIVLVMLSKSEDSGQRILKLISSEDLTTAAFKGSGSGSNCTKSCKSFITVQNGYCFRNGCLFLRLQQPPFGIFCFFVSAHCLCRFKKFLSLSHGIFCVLLLLFFERQGLVIRTELALFLVVRGIHVAVLVLFVTGVILESFELRSFSVFSLLQVAFESVPHVLQNPHDLHRLRRVGACEWCLHEGRHCVPLVSVQEPRGSIECTLQTGLGLQKRYRIELRFVTGHELSVILCYCALTCLVRIHRRQCADCQVQLPNRSLKILLLSRELRVLLVAQIFGLLAGLLIQRHVGRQLCALSAEHSSVSLQL